MDSVRYTNKNIINAGNILGPFLVLESAFRPPYVCYSVDVMTQVLSCLKCCSSMKIVIQLFFGVVKFVVYLPHNLSKKGP